MADDRRDDAERDAGAERDEASPSIRERPPVATATLVRMEGAGRRTTVLAVAIAVFVAVALVKPWPSGTAPGFSLRPGTPPPTEAPSADPLAAIRLDCQDPPGWRIFSREFWSGGVLRSWRSLVPVAGPIDAPEPGDPRRPDQPGHRRARLLRAVGRPGAPAGRRRGAHLVGPERRDRRRRRPAGRAGVGQRDPPAAARGPVRAPPPSGLGPFLWPPGTFVFELAAPGYERWWGVRIPAAPAGRARLGIGPGGRVARTMSRWISDWTGCARWSAARRAASGARSRASSPARGRASP